MKNEVTSLMTYFVMFMNNKVSTMSFFVRKQVMKTHLTLPYN